MPFETVLHSSRGEIESGGSDGYVNEQAAFNSQAELDAFLKRHPRVVPPIDFTTKTAMAILLHAEPTTANTVEIMRIQEHPNGLIVYTVRWLPDFGSAGGQIVGVPFHLVTIPKTDRQVFFKPIVSALRDMYPAGRQPIGEEFPVLMPALRTRPEARLQD